MGEENSFAWLLGCLLTCLLEMGASRFIIYNKEQECFR